MAVTTGQAVVRTVYPPPTLLDHVFCGLLGMVTWFLKGRGVTVMEEHESWARELWPMLEPRGFEFAVHSEQSVHRQGIRFVAGNASVWVGSDMDTKESAIIELYGLVPGSDGRMIECALLEEVASRLGLPPPSPWPENTPSFGDLMVGAMRTRAKLLEQVLDRCPRVSPTGGLGDQARTPLP